MARPAKSLPLVPGDVGGFKYLHSIEALLGPLRDTSAHGNRTLFMDQYVSLLLLYFFNPALTSLRALQQATGLENVQEEVGIKRLSLGALSHNGRYVFDPALLEPILKHVAGQAQQAAQRQARPTLDQTHLAVIAADGSFLKALPSMCWAMFRKKSAHRGVKLHLQLDVRTGLPLYGELGTAMSSEKKALAKALRSEALYLLDRGYLDYSLFQKIHDAGSNFVARIKESCSCHLLKERALSGADAAAGVLIDQEVQVGSEFTAGDLAIPVRRLVVEGADGRRIVLLTDSGLPAQVIADLYRWRWQVELFFRWFKCILGCTHWVSRSRQGLTLQVYVALLASLMIAVWTGRKPSKRTFEMLQLYMMGWAKPHELAAHLAGLKKS
jgi:hypothetical protein